MAIDILVTISFLHKQLDEFKGMNPKEVVSYIEGQPYISTVPVEPNDEIKKQVLGIFTEEIYKSLRNT